MTLNRLAIFTAVLLCVSCLFAGCEDEAQPQSGSIRLSVDTVSFDTVFSTIGTTTAWVVVYNPNTYPLLLERVHLQSGGQSGFRLNLDGDSGTVFQQVTIPAKDSLFLFVSLTASPQASNDPVLLDDVVLFESGGTVQKLPLRAWSWNAILWKGKTLTTDTVLTGDKPFLVYDSLVVAEGAILTLQEGTRLFMHDGARVVVKGTLLASGSRSRPVEFKGDRLDKVFSGLPYSCFPGQWGYIQLTGSSVGNVLDHVRISGAYYGIVADSSSTESLKLTLTNSVVHNMVYNCLLSVSNRIEVGNSQLTNSGDHTVLLLGGQYDFVHCTLANYMWLTTRQGLTLVLASFLSDGNNGIIPYPIQAEFKNCLISGSQREELGFALSADSDITDDVSFRYCLVRTAYQVGEYADRNITTQQEAGFLKLGSEAEGYVYDFRLKNGVQAQNAGLRDYALPFPLDLAGQSRLDDYAPDMGCYEITASN